jgi:hypothetical protein
MSLSARIIHLVVTSLVTLLIAGCSGSSQRTNSNVATLEERLEPGDLIFRRGTGVVGHIVTSVDNSGEYSHVGIAVLKDEEWCVVHAVPHEPDFEGDIDRVKCEALESFVGRYRDGVVGHYRVCAEPELRARVADNALRLSSMNIPFDHDYNLEDSTAFYCTELVEYLYLQYGISLSEGRRTEVNFPSLSGRYIMPSDITESTKLRPIY